MCKQIARIYPLNRSDICIKERQLQELCAGARYNSSLLLDPNYWLGFCYRYRSNSGLRSVDMGHGIRRAAIAGAAYFLLLFAVGFALGTLRVLFVVPRIGQFFAVIAEMPLMLIAAFFICRWAVRHWHVPPAATIRWGMVIWFLALLITFETMLSLTLFGRTIDEQWVAFGTPPGLVGLLAQCIAALLPVLIGAHEQK